ncbi:MAG: hypothetical protein LBM71_05180 [Elusimicrobiota bacterium]|nr:hypothetical protein [Elusimicrobiota bacterium]
MSIIMNPGGKSAKQAADTKRQAYTWVACIMIVVFVLSIAIPLLSREETQSVNNYREKAYDLAAMPFTNDNVEAALLSTDAYSDIGKQDLINTLFSKKDKEDRQASDATQGVPPPPDAEYQEAQTQKEVAEARREYMASRNSARSGGSRAYMPTTSVGSLRTGGGMSVSGGGKSTASAKIWTSDDVKQKTKNNNSTPSADPRSQLLASLGKAGRSTGFVDASLQSRDAANQKDAEAAAGGAIDAFQKGAKAQSTDMLEGDAEKSLAELGDLAAVDPNAAVDGPAAPNWDKLAEALNKSKQEAQKKDFDACARGNFWQKLVCGLPGLVVDVIGKIVDSGLGIVEDLGRKEWGLSGNKQNDTKNQKSTTQSVTNTNGNSSGSQNNGVVDLPVPDGLKYK